MSATVELAVRRYRAAEALTLLSSLTDAQKDVSSRIKGDLDVLIYWAKLCWNDVSKKPLSAPAMKKLKTTTEQWLDYLGVFERPMDEPIPAVKAASALVAACSLVIDVQITCRPYTSGLRWKKAADAAAYVIRGVAAECEEAEVEGTNLYERL